MTPWRFLAFSLIVHFLLWTLFQFTSKHLVSNTKKEEPVEITLVDKSNESPKQLVRQATDLEEKKSKDPKYLSEKDQAVEKETQAAKTGMTANRGGKNGGEKKKIKLSQLAPQLPTKPLNQNNQDSPGNRGSGREKGESTTGERLENTATGPITSLNTERFVYYTFFARIEERLRPLWERRLRELTYSMGAEERRRMNDRTWTAHVEVILDAKGNYIKTIYRQDSGLYAYDKTISDSFAEAKLFPNPPKGMIKDDGKVHLEYNFTFSYF